MTPRSGKRAGSRAEPWSESLPRLLDPERARPLLREACAGSGWSLAEILASEIVQERPERRRTLRYRVLGGRADEEPREILWFVKQYRGSKGERVWRRLRYLHAQTSPDVMTAEPLGYSPRLRLLVVRELQGPTLAEALRGAFEEEDVEASLRRAGRALASVHRFADAPDGIGLEQHGPREEIQVLESARARVDAAALPPELVHRFLAPCSRVEEDLARGEAAARTLLHRDLHPGQIVLRDDGIGLLDWDDASWGEPELDLGNLEAHLLLEDLRRLGSTGPARSRIDALRRGYWTCGTFDPERLETYLASALLRLATLERLAHPSLSVLAWPELFRELIELAPLGRG